MTGGQTVLTDGNVCVLEISPSEKEMQESVWTNNSDFIKTIPPRLRMCPGT